MRLVPCRDACLQPTSWSICVFCQKEFFPEIYGPEEVVAEWMEEELVTDAVEALAGSQSPTELTIMDVLVWENLRNENFTHFDMVLRREMVAALAHFQNISRTSRETGEPRSMIYCHIRRLKIAPSEWQR